LSRIDFAVETPHELLDLAIAFGHQVLIMPVGEERLAEREQVLGAVVAHQRLDDCLLVGAHSFLAQGGQPDRIALSVHDGLDDGHAAQPSDVGEHVVDLQIHLGERFVHVLDVDRGAFDQAGAMAAQGADGADLAVWPERSPQQAHRV
jgi:hypothetical protein